MYSKCLLSLCIPNEICHANEQFNSIQTTLLSQKEKLRTWPAMVIKEKQIHEHNHNEHILLINKAINN